MRPTDNRVCVSTVEINDKGQIVKVINKGAFQKIERIGSNPKNYHFVVTNKDGSKIIYGQNEDAQKKVWKINFTSFFVIN